MTIADTRVKYTTWSHRLVVRTPGFHPGNRSSILRGITTKAAHRMMGFFHAGFIGELNFG